STSSTLSLHDALPICCMSLVVRYALFAGLFYSIVFEGVLANIDFAVRRLTVMYYFRVLIERWLQPDWFRILGGGSNPWSIDLGRSEEHTSELQSRGHL